MMSSRWKKSTLLGKGAFGEVFLASKDDKLIAVKSVCDAEYSNRHEKLKNEEVFLKELNSEPFVVRCFGRDESVEDGRSSYNLLLEYAAGGHLDNLLARSPLTNAPLTNAARVARLTRMLLTALERIHARGIVHCDLKPANVLVFPVPGRPPQLKIADFGQAEWVSAPDEAYGRGRDFKYWNKGTTPYASPEAVTRGEHRTCTDIWSLGIIVAEMMDPGSCFYYYEDREDVYDLIVSGHFDLDRKVPKHFDHHAHAVDFLNKYLDRDPANRWSARQLLKHPFITENLQSPLVVDQIKAENPIQPSRKWVASYHLFTNDAGEGNDVLFMTDEDEDEELPPWMQILDGSLLL